MLSTGTRHPAPIAVALAAATPLRTGSGGDERLIGLPVVSLGHKIASPNACL